MRWFHRSSARFSPFLGLLLPLAAGLGLEASSPAGALPPALLQAGGQATALDPALVTADNTLGFALAAQAAGRAPESNLLLSPLSLSLCLDLAYAGSAGATRRAMGAALGLGPVADPDQANAVLRANLKTGDPGARLTLANALWARPGIPLPSFLDLNRTCYGAYVGDLDGGPAAVNAWVARQTQGLIPELVPADSALADCDLLLVNTLCFQGAWTFPFDPAVTAPGTFTRPDGSRVTRPFMNNTRIMEYAENLRLQAVRLGFGRDQRFTLLLVLPAPGLRIQDLDLDAERFQALLQGMGLRQVALALPRFGFACAVPLRDALAGLGMGIAFDPSRADFSAMATRPEVMLRVLHRTRIQVDEKGLLAAAGSGVEMAPTSVGEPPVPLTLDRPFAFALVDGRTGTVAFLGQVTDPT